MPKQKTETKQPETETTTQASTEQEALPEEKSTPAAEESGSEFKNPFTEMTAEMDAEDLETGEDSSDEKETTETEAEKPAEEKPAVEAAAKPAAEKPEAKPAETETAAPDEGKKPAEIPSETPEQKAAKEKVEADVKALAEAKVLVDADAKAKVDAEAARAAEAEAEKPTETSQELLSLLNERRGETIEVLAKSHFALTDEQVVEMDENPREAIPKLLAGLYLDAVQGAASTILTQLPHIIPSIGKQQEAVAAAERAFYKTWPELEKTDELKAHVKKVSELHRKLNPKATLEEMIRDVGVQTSLVFKLPIPEGNKLAGTQDTVVPFVPAAADGNKPPVPAAAGSDNPFTQMAEDMLEEDAT